MGGFFEVLVTTARHDDVFALALRHDFGVMDAGDSDGRALLRAQAPSLDSARARLRELAEELRALGIVVFGYRVAFMIDDSDLGDTQSLVTRESDIPGGDPVPESGYGAPDAAGFGAVGAEDPPTEQIPLIAPEPDVRTPTPRHVGPPPTPPREAPAMESFSFDEKVDEVLRKIHAQGRDSLTVAEAILLAEAVTVYRAKHPNATPRSCCALRRKVALSPTVLSEESCGVPDSALADVVRYDAAGGPPVLVAAFCAWCGTKREPGTEERITQPKRAA